MQPSTSNVPHWASAAAPSLEDIERMADKAFAALPDEFRTLCEGLVFKVEDFPDQDVLDRMHCESRFGILGLFSGFGMARQGASPRTGQLPNMIWLYRCPILRYAAESQNSLEDVVTHVLVHEIGHHFGLSDDDIDAIESAP